MKPYVLAVDPGLTSGVCIVTRDGLQALWVSELAWEDLTREVAKALNQLGGEHVDIVSERFVITPLTGRNSQATWSLEVTGMLRLLARLHGAEPVTLQSASDAKNFCPNGRLAALELRQKSSKPHANDALRHAVLRLARTGAPDPRLSVVYKY